jgi:hypothetical protein
LPFFQSVPVETYYSLLLVHVAICPCTDHPFPPLAPLAPIAAVVAIALRRDAPVLPLPVADSIPEPAVGELEDRPVPGGVNLDSILVGRVAVDQGIYWGDSDGPSVHNRAEAYLLCCRQGIDDNWAMP